jgi:hypothetical protein
MKVLSYIQYADLSIPQKDKLIAYVGIKFDENNRVHQFYSQKFNPELIVELFEGWEEKIINNFVHRTNGIYEIVFNSAGRMILLNGNPNWAGEFNSPRTLDDFITDCQRFKIELTWNTHLTNRS